MFAKAALVLSAFALSAPIAAAPSTDQSRIARVENGLLPAVSIVGEPNPRMSIESRMANYHVPAVSVAVIDGYRMSWSRAYGTLTPGGSPATPQTLFQAASISKPVAAAAALRLVYEGRLSLEAPANRYLSSWRVLDSPFASGNAVTLRRLLSHSAGLSPSGFAGYAPGGPIPTLRQLLDGQPPANSEPVRMAQAPGAFRYSGGGYSVVQQMIEDVTRLSFAEALHRSVLAPLGMDSSFFDQPLPARRRALAAAAHTAQGERLDGGWHVYPELAAAGLWTTPSDLARFVLWVMDGLEGHHASPMQTFVSRHLTEPQPGLDSGGGERVGLGLFLRGNGNASEFRHDGENAGYRALLVAFPATGQGAVIMTNGDGAAPLLLEILRSIAAEYDWPTRFHESVAPVRLGPAQLAALTGGYRLGPQPNQRADFTVEADALIVRIGRLPAMPLIALDPRSFISRNGFRFRFGPGRVEISPPAGAPITAVRERPQD